MSENHKQNYPTQDFSLIIQIGWLHFSRCRENIEDAQYQFVGETDGDEAVIPCHQQDVDGDGLDDIQLAIGYDEN